MVNDPSLSIALCMKNYKSMYSGYDLCHPVAAPAQQRSQVISRSEHPRARSPGCTFFMTTFFVVALKTQRPPTPLRLFHCQNKQIKRSAISGQIW